MMVHFCQEISVLCRVIYPGPEKTVEKLYRLFFLVVEKLYRLFCLVLIVMLVGTV
jgi:hypothetical protein